MKISEARYNANKKWNKENYAQINLTLPKEKKPEIVAFAKAQGKSTNSFILEAVDEKIERDSGDS